jgi:uncharacterized membrane protein/protein-disulfide isomerase
MSRRSAGSPVAAALAPPPPSVLGYVIAALAGLGFSATSVWVHYRLLHDPTYTSFCDVSSTVSCTEAYTSRYGSVGGVPVALLGVLFFAFVLVLIALCRRSESARQNLPGYMFAVSTIGLAVVLYLAYASFFVLGAVCLLCVGTYIATIALFLLSGSAARFPMSTLPGRAGRDIGTLVRTPAALTAAIGFGAAAIAAIVLFPGQPLSAESAPRANGSEPIQELAVPPAPPQEQITELETWLSRQGREPLVAAAGDATVALVKFNDYQCPPCRQTYMQYKPILAKYEKTSPGKVKLIIKDYPLDPECNAFAPGGQHTSACEAAVAVRLAREHGKAEAMEEWLFSNQPTVTPQGVKDAVKTVAGVTDFDARYPNILTLVRADIAQGGQLEVRGTPTFFMNGIRLPNLQPQFLDVAIAWELKRIAEGRAR